MTTIGWGVPPTREASRAPAHARRVWATSSALALQHWQGNATLCRSPGTLMDHAWQREATGAFLCLNQLVSIILDGGDFLWRELYLLKECLDRVPAPDDGGLVLWGEVERQNPGKVLISPQAELSR